MGKKQAKLGKHVTETAKIKSCSIGIHADNLVFCELNFSSEDQQVVSQLIKGEDAVLVTIEIPTDAKWPKITAEATLKASKISKTCDNPSLVGLQFSTKQIGQLTNLIRTEEEIQLTITQVQAELFDEKAT